MAIAELAVNLVANTGNFVKNINKVSKETEKTFRSIEQTGKQMQSMGKSIMGLTAPLVALGTMGVRSFAGFDSAMTKSLAIMGDVSTEMRENMVKAADEVARATTFSSEQAAESYFFLASAGLNAEQSIAALPQVAKFAQAGMFDMARATDLATDAQSALGMTVQDAGENLQNLTRITDVLVGANTLANASVEQFAEALTNRAGAALKNAGKDIEEGVAVLAAFADQGIKGREAGTALGIVMRDLQTQFRKNTEEFKKAGVAVFDAEGNFNNLGEVIGDIEKRLEGMSAQQRNATLAQLGFTDKSIAFIQTLLGSSEAIQNYEKDLRGMQGITDEVANKQLQTFTSQMKLLRNEFDIASRSIGEVLVPKIMEVTKHVKSAIDWFSGLSKETKEQIVNWSLLATGLGAGLFILGKIVSIVASLALVFTKLNPVIAGITLVVMAGAAVWVTYGDEIKKSLTNASLYWEEFVRTLKTEFPIISKIVQDWADLNKSILDQLKSWYADYFNFLIDNLYKVGRSFKSFLSVVTEGFKKSHPETAKSIENFAKIKERVDDFAESQVKAKKTTDEFVSSFFGANKAVEKFSTSVSEGGSELMTFGYLTKEVKEETKKTSGVLDELGEDAKKAAEKAKSALEGLQQKWKDLNRSFKEKELKASIEAAVKAGNEAELQPLLEALRKHTKEGILEGMDSAIKDGGQKGKELGDKIAEAQADAMIREEEGRIAEARKKAAQENATLWERLTGQAGENSAQQWGVALGNASAEGAQVFAMNMDQQMALAMQGLNNISNYIKDGIFNGFKTENFINLGRQLGSSIGQAAGTAIAGPIGGAIGDIVGSVWGDKLAKNLSGIGKGGKDTAKGIYTIMTMDPITGELLRPVFNSLFKGTTNIATLARREFEKQFNEMIDGKNIRIFDENGVLREIDKISVGAKDRFNGNWADSFHQLTGDASSAFLGIGYALQHLMGITEDVGGQIAAILADELGGSVQNLALLLMGLDIPIQDMEAAMVEAFMNGSISAHDFSVFMQGIAQGYAELERAQNDLGLAIQLWLGSGGKGEQAVRSFQAVANAAMSQGIRSVEDFVAQAVASGMLTAEQGEQALRAFALHGITSLDQIANASDAMLIHILGSLETMEKEGENSFFGVAEKVNENFQNIEDRWERIRKLPPAILQLEIKANDYKVPEIISKEVKPMNKTTSMNIPALDSGGVVANPTLALIGERRKEAVIPLDELPSMMEDIMSRAGSVSEKAMGAVFNIDARGAMRGVGEEIKNALINFVDVRNGLLGTT